MNDPSQVKNSDSSNEGNNTSWLTTTAASKGPTQSSSSSFPPPSFDINSTSMNNDAIIPTSSKPTTNPSSSSPIQIQSNPNFGLFRSMVGSIMTNTSEIINDNIIIIRYGTFSVITLLGAYGISKTPIFFRYKSIHDIPSDWFTKRRKIHGRIVGVVKNQHKQSLEEKKKNVEKPITCLVRHLSPMGRLLNVKGFEFVMRHAGGGSAGGGSITGMEDGAVGDLLKIEIAGIKQGPSYSAKSHLEQEGEWIRRLAEQRANVTCQLIAIRNQTDHEDDASVGDMNTVSGIETEHTAALCQVKYRPGKSLFRTDLASSLVSFGRANVIESGTMHIESSSSSSLSSSSPRSKILHATTNIKQLQKDARYMEQLSNIETKAIQTHKGMWADSYIRTVEKKDLVEEVMETVNITPIKRFWNWLRGN